jgi:hypothetical protein
VVVDLLDLIEQRSIVIHHHRRHRRIGQRRMIRRDMRAPDGLPGHRPVTRTVMPVDDGQL